MEKPLADRIDLSRHAVVEASAGTGKTYTLERLVRRILLEQDVAIDQILLVTYTEKATGEIKQRLRGMLLSEASEHPKLNAALQRFDQASVFTIHGFCQRVLQEFAFENQQDFQPQLVDDGEILLICLRELQRKHWRQEYGEQLSFLLNLAGYAGQKGKAWEERVVGMAKRLRIPCGHQLLPAPLDNFAEYLSRSRDTARQTLEEIRGMAEPLDSAALDEHPWMAGYLKLPHNSRELKSRHRDWLTPVVEWIISEKSKQKPLLSFTALVQRLNSWKLFQSHGFLALADKLSARSQPELPKHCPRLKEALESLEQLRLQFDWAQMQNQLAVQTIHALQQKSEEWKREQGRQSFEDMLTRMAEGLDPDRNPDAELLAQTLRKRYRVAIVDEFQDTDLLQWNIFKRIFVDGNNTRLYLIGDPKQAIYGFRGADWWTYVAAAEELQTKHHGVLHPLDVNWRSCEALVEALNHLFREGEWFRSPIDYIDVQAAPDDDRRPYRIASDHTRRAALTIVDHTDKTKAKDVLKGHARFIVSEIARLLSLKPALTFHKKGEAQKRTLNAGDIAILVRKRSEAVPIIDGLNQHDIPYTFYKLGGLWDSAEAEQLHCVLRALVEPHSESAFRRLLLTCFFCVSPQDLAQADEIPPQHAARGLFLDWLILSEKRHWATLFQSLWDDSKLLHGERDAERDRRLANFRHLTNALLQTAYENNLDALGVLDVLEQRKQNPPREDDNVQPIDSDQSKVRFLTIHASKGLEFPIVFLAGDYTEKTWFEFDQYRDDGNHIVFDLSQTKEARQKAKIERDDESRRLLYVALTRAIFKLYVPLAPEIKGAGAGPAIRLMRPALTVLKDIEPPTPGAWRFIEPSVPQTEIALEAESPTLDVEPIKLPKDLFLKIDDNLKNRRRTLYSFTKLHQQAAADETERATFPDQEAREDDDQPDALTQPDQLRGPVFGDMVHVLMEKVDFNEVGNAKSPQELLRQSAQYRRLLENQIQKNAPKIRSTLSRSELEQQCRDEVTALIWTTLRTPLSPIGKPLWRIPAQNRLHEVEFLSHHMKAEFFTGFIDVVFRHEGQFYIVDYKTNLLASYDRDTIHDSIRDNDYERQFRIYLQALATWLRKATGKVEIGGVLYLYVRGLTGKDDSTGVYFHTPTAEDLRVESVLRQA